MDLREVEVMNPKDDEFAKLAMIVAKKINELRQDEGTLPYQVWLSNLVAQGTYPCLEIMMTDRNKNSVWLKTREDKENVTRVEKENWKSKLHIPGTVFNLGSRLDEWVSKLIKKEFLSEVGAYMAQELALTVRPWSIALYPEPERMTTALTIIMEMPIPKSGLRGFQTGFVEVDDSRDARIIKQHQHIVSVFLNKIQPVFLDDR